MIKNNHPETVVPTEPQFAKPRVHKASEHALVRLHTLHPLHAFAARSSVAACADRTPTMTAVIAYRILGSGAIVHVDDPRLACKIFVGRWRMPWRRV